MGGSNGTAEGVADERDVVRASIIGITLAVRSVAGATVREGCSVPGAAAIAGAALSALEGTTATRSFNRRSRSFANFSGSTLFVSVTRVASVAAVSAVAPVPAVTAVAATKRFCASSSAPFEPGGKSYGAAGRSTRRSTGTANVGKRKFLL